MARRAVSASLPPCLRRVVAWDRQRNNGRLSFPLTRPSPTAGEGTSDSYFFADPWRFGHQPPRRSTWPVRVPWCPSNLAAPSHRVRVATCATGRDSRSHRRLADVWHVSPTRPVSSQPSWWPPCGAELVPGWQALPASSGRSGSVWLSVARVRKDPPVRRHLGSGSSPSDSTAKDGPSTPARHRRHWAAWNVPSQVQPAPGSALPRVGYDQPAPRIEPRRPSPRRSPSATYATIANHPLQPFLGFCTLAEWTRYSATTKSSCRPRGISPPCHPPAGSVP